MSSYPGQFLAGAQAVTAPSGFVNPSDPVANNSVARELEQRAMQAQILHKAIEELAMRLESILTPVPPSSGTAGGAVSQAQMSSTVVGHLRTQGYQIDAAIVRLSEIVNRLEL